MEDLLPKLIEKSLTSRPVEFMDVRIQQSYGTEIRCIDGRTREISSFSENGACIRAFVNGSYGFTAVNNLSPESIESAMKSAIKLAKFGESHAKVKFNLPERQGTKDFTKTPAKIKLPDVSMEEKINFALELDKEAKTFDERIINRNVGYSDLVDKTTICNSNGSFIEREMNYVYLGVSTYAVENGNRQRGRESVAHVGGWELMSTEKARNSGRVAAEKAIRLLQAKAPRSGTFPTILNPTLGGVFVHEAFGHCCEADAVLNGASILEGKIGERVAADAVTIIDDGTKLPLYGSYHYDSEGSPASRTILVENGILKSYLHSMESATRMELEQSTGNCRASGFQVLPVIRMSNTYLEVGDWNFEEMLEDVKDGIFAKDWSYGYVNPAKGTFAFKAGESYEIKNGELGAIMRDCTLSGMTLETLHDIIGLGKDIKFTPGTCGKAGQSMPVTDGSPYIYLKKCTWGGLQR